MSSNEHILDNPVWHALTSGVHERFAFGTDKARRYPLEIVPLAGLVDHSDAAFADLEKLTEPGKFLAISGLTLPDPVPGWKTEFVVKVNQMVCEQPIAEPDNAEMVVDLSEADVSDMLHLVEIAEPGPFSPRAIELGHYVGIRWNGQLVAMAGERVRPPGYSEISTVCTHPDYRGRGYAQLLVRKVAAWNWQRGDVPYLHVLPQNSPAIHVYERLHFRKRAEVQVLVISR